MIQRVIDATFLNTVANHADVRPWIGGAGVLDLQPLLSDYGNVAFQSEHGGLIAHQTDDGIYEAHSLFLPAGRGKHAVHAVNEAIAYMFTRTNAVELITKVPSGNAAAQGLAQLCGFRARFTVKGTFTHLDGPQDVTVYGLTVNEWALASKETEGAGQKFHNQLHAVKADLGGTTVNHVDDPVHDRFAGLAALCIYAGNAAKGVRLYNRWARSAGYAELALMSEHPVVVDIVDAVLSLGPQETWEILLCR